MTVVYEDGELVIKKKNKKEFIFLIKNWDGEYKKFWVNFPFSLIKIISTKKEKDQKEYTMHINKAEMLDDLIKRHKNLSYIDCLTMLYDIGNQLQSLEMFNMGMPFLKLSDIMVVNDRHFFIVNTSRVLPISNDRITINTPYKRTPFFSPELQNLNGIPAKLNWKTSYYSLASLVVYCLTGEHILGNKLSSGEIMDKLYETKLFWALQRCLVVNPEDRYYLII